ncbi:MAG: hypothetical protein UX17_C0014G0013 [Parcubacteria group bacterium GW2011_GWC2_45_7]|nr:MAG: hypothetical protein UX17_C0014G0013 [Parcubacteria group bacterium GW2011_GWC2_45_7]KKU74029.1 MAG: hypothetical protein UX98_C0002G0059 [Parcubacteria group bacterium GW2011_GWA2_47_26]
MITETKDIFYLVLAFCVLWFTIFVCWLLYYFIAIMRDARGMVRDVREKISRIEEVAHLVKDKIEKSLSIFVVLADGFKYILQFLGERGRFNGRKTRKRKSEETRDEAREEHEEHLTEK